MRQVRTLLLGLLVVAGAVGHRAGAQDVSQPGPRLASQRDVSVVRSNGTSFTATVHYPALASTSAAAVDVGNGPYPIVAFGHGFVTPVTQYVSLGRHLASWGFIVVLPQTQGSLAPSHSQFAADLLSSLDWFASQGSEVGSPWLNAVAADRRGLMGHSMGGGCALLAASQSSNTRAVVPLAAADTNPSSTAACASVWAPTRIIVGSQDTIVPPTTNTPMFQNLPGSAQLVSITGGSHCGFIDSSTLFCDSGALTRAQQLAITRREVTEFLLLYLQGNASSWSAVWNSPAPSDGVTQQARQTADLDGDGRVSGADLGLLLNNWGGSGRGDLNNDGTVDGADLGTLLATWRP